MLLLKLPLQHHNFKQSCQVSTDLYSMHSMRRGEENWTKGSQRHLFHGLLKNAIFKGRTCENYATRNR